VLSLKPKFFSTLLLNHTYGNLLKFFGSSKVEELVGVVRVKAEAEEDSITKKNSAPIVIR